MAADKKIFLVTGVDDSPKPLDEVMLTQIPQHKGSNNGIGFDTCAYLAKDSSNNHVLVCSRSVDKGKKALADLEAQKPQGSLSLLQLDVSDPASIAAAAKAVECDYGKLDVLINNAGVVSFNPDTMANYHEAFNANFFGAVATTEAFLPLLRKSDTRRIIYVSSTLGSSTMRSDKSYFGYAVKGNSYRTSKAAMNMLAACNHEDLGEEGFKVHAVCPGFVVSNLTGETGRKERIERGAPSSETSASFILDVAKGSRDSDCGKFIDKNGVNPF